MPSPCGSYPLGTPLESPAIPTMAAKGSNSTNEGSSGTGSHMRTHEFRSQNFASPVNYTSQQPSACQCGRNDECNPVLLLGDLPTNSSKLHGKPTTIECLQATHLQPMSPSSASVHGWRVAWLCVWWMLWWFFHRISKDHGSGVRYFWRLGKKGTFVQQNS